MKAIPKPKGDKIFVIQLQFLDGTVIGTKIAEAPSKEFIRKNPHLFVGPERKIGKIVPTDFKSVDEAVRAAQVAHGYHVENGVRVYDQKPQDNTVWDKASKA